MMRGEKEPPVREAAACLEPYAPAGRAPLADRVRAAGWGLQPADAVFLFTLVAFSGLTVLVFGTSAASWKQVFRNLAVGLALLGSIRLERRASSRAARFAIRLMAVQLMFAVVFPLVTPLQLTFDKTWNDPAVLGWEQALFGVQPTVWLQRLVSPALTEWLMFSYIAYFPLYPILCAVLYFKRGVQAMEDYIFALALANLACCVGFLILPIAGPLYWMADQYTVPLRGGLFTALGEFVRLRLQGIGASLPSPHCANATIMWIVAFRHHRPTFFLITPIVVSIYVSAFYGRYHYLSDVVCGIAVGAAAMAVLPAAIRAWNGRSNGAPLPPDAT